MAQTLPNGVVIPQQGEPISAAGVQEMRTLGASVDTALASKLQDADLAPLRAASFNRGVLPANTDTRTYITEAHSGLWHIRSQAAAAGMIGLPDGLQVQGEFLVIAGGPATQMFFPYGFYGAAPMTRSVTNVATGALSAWQPLGGGGAAGAGVGPWVQNHIRKAQFMQAMGGPIDTGGKAVVAVRCDHGLLPFRDKVLPLVKARGLTVSQAYNPRNWHYDENAGVTPAELNGWVAAGDVEIWNHSANHLDASDESALEDTIVGGLAEIEAELPAARGKVWGFAPPGVDQTTGYGGFGNGNSPEKWDTPAGRLILQHHAVASAYLPGTSIRPLDGTVRDGQSHITMDSISVATIKGYIDQAIAQRGGLQLMLHPSQLDLAGKLTTAQLTEVLDYIVAKRTSGELVTLSPYEMAVADSTGVPTAGRYDSGARLINSFISAGWTPATDGARILRQGREVTLYVDLYRVGELTGSFDAVIDIPVGMRPMGVGYQSPAKVTSGPSGWWEMSGTNLRIRDLTGPVAAGARIRNTIKWTTLETPPPNPPGSNV